MSPETRQQYEKSVTEHEIDDAVFGVPDAREHVFVFRRRARGLSADSDQDSRSRVESLAGRLRAHLGSANVFDHYKVEYDDKNENEKRLEELCHDILTKLSGVILNEIKRRDQGDSIEQEETAHRIFGEVRTKSFVGRKDLLEQIGEHMMGASSAPFVLSGDSGIGKTSVMARAAEQASNSHPRAKIVQRYVGASAESLDGRTLVEGLCAEIARAFDSSPGTRMGSFDDVGEDFRRLLGLATEDKRLIVFLDGLDLLQPGDPAQDLWWLPVSLPPCVRIIVSLAEGDLLQSLAPRVPDSNFKTIQPMSRPDAADLLRSWLTEEKRNLTPDQVEAILGEFANSGSPLYLRLAFEEAKGLHSYDGPPKLGKDTPALIAGMLERLSDDRNHGKPLVAIALGYLAASRHGLAEGELLKLLRSEKSGIGGFLVEDYLRRSPMSPKVNELPTVLWSRMRFDLEPYLTERRSGGVLLLSFSRPELAAAIRSTLLAGEESQRHQEIADHFAREPSRYGPRPNFRKLAELVFQQVRAGDWDGVEGTCCDLEFLVAKCEAGWVHDLVLDCDSALAAHSMPVVAVLRGVLGDALPVLTERPNLALQSLYNRLKWSVPLPLQFGEVLHKAESRLNCQTHWIAAEGRLPRRQLRVSFAEEAIATDVSFRAHAVVTLSRSGLVDLYDLDTGQRLRRRKLEGSRITTISLSQRPRRISWLEASGIVQAEDSPRSLHERPGERHLASHAARGLIFVREDNCLVAWQPDGASVQTIAQHVPAPLVVLKVDESTGTILWVAGNEGAILGIATPIEQEWQARTIPIAGRLVVDADYDPASGRVLLLDANRTLTLLDAASGKHLTMLSYEKRAGVVVTGRPHKCSLGAEDDAYFATGDGHVARWNWRDDGLVRLADCGSVSAPEIVGVFRVDRQTGLLLIATSEWAAAWDASGSREHSRGHSSPVTACAFAGSGKLCSASSVDHSIRWWSRQLEPLCLAVHRGLTTIARGIGQDDVLVGNGHGEVWNQPPTGAVGPTICVPVFNEPVVSLFLDGGVAAIAAAKSGTIKRVSLSSREPPSVLHQTDGYRDQLRIFAGQMQGTCLSLWRKHARDGMPTFLSLVVRGSREKVLFRSPPVISDIAVSRDGKTMYLAGESLRVFRRTWWGLGVKCRRDSTPVRYIALLGDEDLLAVARADGSGNWLEIWQLADRMPTVAAMELPGEITSLAAQGWSVMAGLRSGAVVSMTVRGAACRERRQEGI
jgi:WD40 repeat protein